MEPLGSPRTSTSSTIATPTTSSASSRRSLRTVRTFAGLFGHKVRVLSLPKLIAVKRAAGRPKDFEAIAELEAMLAERSESEG